MISIKSLFIPYPYFCGQTKYIVFHEKNYNYRCNFRHRSWIGRSLFSRRLSYRHYRSQGKSIRRGMRPGQRQTILSSVRHHRYTSYHFIPQNSHSKDGWNGYIDYLCRDRRTKPRTLLPIGRTYLTNERDRIHQHRRLGFPIFRTAKKRASGYYFLCWRYTRQWHRSRLQCVESLSNQLYGRITTKSN